MGKKIAHAYHFSLDSNYIIAWEKLEGNQNNIKIQTYNKNGELKWDGLFSSQFFTEMEIAKIVTGGYIVWNYKKHYKKIYDYLGNVIAEIPNEVKKAYVSPDGKAVLYQYDIGKNR